MKRIFAFIFGSLLILSVFAGCKTSGSEQKDTGGLKSFQAETLDGGSFTQDDIADKDLTVINFWGTYCSPCLDEMPDLASFSKALPENVQFITVCVDGGIVPEGAKSILQEAGYEGITLINGDGDFKTLLDEIQAIPTTIFVDSQGNLAGDVIIGGGYENLSEVFLKAVNTALKEGGKAEISLES